LKKKEPEEDPAAPHNTLNPTIGDGIVDDVLMDSNGDGLSEVSMTGAHGGNKGSGKSEKSGGSEGGKGSEGGGDLQVNTESKWNAPRFSLSNIHNPVMGATMNALDDVKRSEFLKFLTVLAVDERRTADLFTLFEDDELRVEDRAIITTEDTEQDRDDSERNSDLASLADFLMEELPKQDEITERYWFDFDA
jgi:hypothetical protein